MVAPLDFVRRTSWHVFEDFSGGVRRRPGRCIIRGQDGAPRDFSACPLPIRCETFDGLGELVLDAPPGKYDCFDERARTDGRVLAGTYSSSASRGTLDTGANKIAIFRHFRKLKEK